MVSITVFRRFFESIIILSLKRIIKEPLIKMTLISVPQRFTASLDHRKCRYNSLRNRKHTRIRSHNLPHGALAQSARLMPVPVAKKATRRS